MHNNGPLQPIRYRQIMFTEFQNGDGIEIRSQARFYAHQANDYDFAARWLGRGPVRLWSFDRDDAHLEPWPSYPSTDHPYEGWYRAGLQQQRVIR